MIPGRKDYPVLGRCGTPRGFHAHRILREEICGECAVAHRVRSCEPCKKAWEIAHPELAAT